MHGNPYRRDGVPRPPPPAEKLGTRESGAGEERATPIPAPAQGTQNSAGQETGGACTAKPPPNGHSRCMATRLHNRTRCSSDDGCPQARAVCRRLDGAVHTQLRQALLDVLLELGVQVEHGAVNARHTVQRVRTHLGHAASDAHCVQQHAAMQGTSPSRVL
jgi:hypothetical protein